MPDQQNVRESRNAARPARSGLTALVALCLIALPLTVWHPAPAFARDRDERDAMREMQQQLEQQRREAQRQMAEQQREARKLQEEQQREARRAQQELAREQQRQAREAEREQQKQAREAEREQQKQAREAQQEAARSTRSEARESSRSTREDSTKSEATSISNSAKSTSSAAQENSSDKSAQPSKRSDDKSDGKGKSKSEANGDDKDEDDTSTTTAKIVDDSPPPTVQKWLEKIFSTSEDGDDDAKKTATASTSTSKSEAKPGAATGPSAAQPKSQATNAAAKATTEADDGTVKPVRGATPPPLAFPHGLAPDVLAVNPSPAALQRARALGFTSSPASKIASLGAALTRLQPPPGMSPTTARDLLARTLPEASFALNRKYRLYRTASDTGQNAPVRPSATPPTAGEAPARRAGGCTSDRCFARDLIGWTPDLNACAQGLHIGIVDTAVDVSHPAFAGKSIEVRNLNETAKQGPSWHGTGVTALLAGDTEGGTPGLIPQASFYVANAFYADTDDAPASDTMSMLRALDWLDAKGARIINLSLSGPPDDLIRQAIDTLSAKGVVFVAAAGNEGPHGAPSYPAAYDNVIAVTAVTKDLTSYRHANRGSYIDVSAPGVGIWTALPGAKEGFHSGTSFATPYVTAALAAVYPKLTTKSAAAALKTLQVRDLGAPGPDPVYGHGLVVAPTSCAPAQIAERSNAPAANAPASAPSRGPASASSGERLPWLTLAPN